MAGLSAAGRVAATAILGSRTALFRPLVATRAGRPPRGSKFATKADLTRADLVKIVAEKAYIEPDTARSVVDALLNSIVNSVAKGEKVAVLGFGSWERVIRGARTGRNPSSGETISIPEKAAVSFKPGKVFKETVATAHGKN